MENNTEKLKNIIENRLSAKRFQHTLRVVDTALNLADIYSVSFRKVTIAALLHDYAKNLDGEELLRIAEEAKHPVNEVERAEPFLLHAPVAAILVKKEFGIMDSEILEAIAYHTTGKANLSKVGKIVYIADAIEPSRKYPKIEKIREIVKTDLDEGFLLSLDSTIEYLLKTEALIHPLSIEARNSILMEKKNKK